MKNIRGIKLAKKLLLAQFLTALVLAFVGFIFGGFLVFKSVLLGAFTVIVPTLFFIMIFFRHTGAQNSRQIARNFYLAEVVKFTLSIILFVLVFVFAAINPLMFFVTFIILQMLSWFFLLHGR